MRVATGSHRFSGVTMAKKKKASLKPKRKRPIRRATKVLLKRSERKQITEFSKYIPSLESLKGREKISSAEYGAFKRAKGKLRHTDNLKPVTAAQAKRLKGKLVGGGVRAVRLRNTSPDATVRVRKGGIIVTSNGREWEYHPVSVRNAGELAEALIKKGYSLFARKNKPAWQLHMWTSKGRSNEGAASYEKWVQLVVAFFNAYQNSTDFINGVAAMVTDVGGKTRKPIPKSELRDIEPDEIEDDEEE